MLGNKRESFVIADALSRAKVAEVQRKKASIKTSSSNIKANNNHRPSKATRPLSISESTSTENPGEKQKEEKTTKGQHAAYTHTVTETSSSHPHSKKKALWLKVNFTVKTAKLQTLKKHKYQHLQEEALLKARGLLDDWENGPVLLIEDLYRLASLEGKDAQEFLNYTPEALALRFSLRNNPDILLVIKDIWAIEMNRDTFGCIQEKAYKDFLLRIAKCLEQKDFDRKQAEKQIDDDWKRDAKGETSMSFANFFDAMFELADLWCETMDPQEYVTFLTRLRDRISCTDVHSKRVLKNIKLVVGLHQELIQPNKSKRRLAAVPDEPSSTGEPFDEKTSSPQGHETAMKLFRAQANLVLAVTALSSSIAKKNTTPLDSTTAPRQNSLLGSIGEQRFSVSDDSGQTTISNFGLEHKALASMASLQQGEQGKIGTRATSTFKLSNSNSNTENTGGLGVMLAGYAAPDIQSMSIATIGNWNMSIEEEQDDVKKKLRDSLLVPKAKYLLKKDTTTVPNNSPQKKISSGSPAAMAGSSKLINMQLPPMNLNDPSASIQVLSTGSIAGEEADRTAQKNSSISLSEAADDMPSGSDNSPFLMKTSAIAVTADVQNDISSLQPSITPNNRQSIQLPVQNLSPYKGSDELLSLNGIGVASNTQFKNFPSYIRLVSSALHHLQMGTSPKAVHISSSSGNRAFSWSALPQTPLKQVSPGKKPVRSTEKPPKTPNRRQSQSPQEAAAPWTTTTTGFGPNHDENIDLALRSSVPQDQWSSDTQNGWVPIDSLPKLSMKGKSASPSKSKQSSKKNQEIPLPHKNRDDWLGEFGFLGQDDLNEDAHEDGVDKPMGTCVRARASSPTTAQLARTPPYVLEQQEGADKNLGSDDSSKTLGASLSVTSLGSCSKFSPIPRLISSSQCSTRPRLLLFPATPERNLRPYQQEDFNMMDEEREQLRLCDRRPVSPNASNVAHILSLQLPEAITSVKPGKTEAEHDPVTHDLSAETAPVSSSFKTTSFSKATSTFGLRPVQEPRKQPTNEELKAQLEILGEAPLVGHDSMIHPKTPLIPLSVLTLAENCKRKPMPSVVCTCFYKSMDSRHGSIQQCAAHFKLDIPEEDEEDEQFEEGHGEERYDGLLFQEKHDECPQLAPLEAPCEDAINGTKHSPPGSPVSPPGSPGRTSQLASFSPSKSRASKRGETPMILINSTKSIVLEKPNDTIIQVQEEEQIPSNPFLSTWVDKYAPKKVARPQYTFGRKLTSYPPL